MTDTIRETDNSLINAVLMRPGIQTEIFNNGIITANLVHHIFTTEVKGIKEIRHSYKFCITDNNNNKAGFNIKEIQGVSMTPNHDRVLKFCADLRALMTQGLRFENLAFTIMELCRGENDIKLELIPEFPFVSEYVEPYEN